MPLSPGIKESVLLLVLVHVLIGDPSRLLTRVVVAVLQDKVRIVPRGTVPASDILVVDHQHNGIGVIGTRHMLIPSLYIISSPSVLPLTIVLVMLSHPLERVPCLAVCLSHNTACQRPPLPCPLEDSLIERYNTTIH